MKHLPVPPLHQSLDRYLAAVRPLLDATQQRRAQEAVESFASTDGPACQVALLRLADEENAAGHSWLSRAWLATYLANRAPLPLSSNVGFRVRSSTEDVGVGRAADAIHRVAHTQLHHLNEEITGVSEPVLKSTVPRRSWALIRPRAASWCDEKFRLSNLSGSR